MIYKVYAMRDHASKQFLSPMVDTGDEVAKRNFAYAINNNPQLAFKPDDFALYCIGTYDSETGVVAALESGVDLVMVGTECVFEEVK